ncbi:hypothetical protein ABL78_0052 [Leptomonas seymouri]|uniref:Uncharacterized protein n=1 Tax=Leptomonas seymouri TaxID=5684 RepID=A0A0N0P986_LEPSE|nr:hypothetical protein ABL78_0052 [Leptomonas seymouri]|eukprot:KPI90819.1 hypothetical protein ABL78_0052 [Leptomonas seymouri]
MLKNIKSGLQHINPKGLHLHTRRDSKGGSDTAAVELDGEKSTHDVPAPPDVAVGPKSVPSPGMPPVKLPPGAVVKGPLPPGMKVIKGPPPGEGIKFMYSGTGSTSPPRPGAGSPTPYSVSGASPPGIKLMAHPPPGAKVLSGAPPPGAKVMQGAPPPGAKIMQAPSPPGAKVVHGSPPAGAKIIHGAPPPGAKLIHGSPPSGLIRPGSPSLVGPNAVSAHRNASPPPGMASKTPPMMSPPPGMKLIHGPPPHGSRPISPEELRTLTGSPSLIPSRSVSPTNPPVYRILPNGVKVIVRPSSADATGVVSSTTPRGSTTHPTPPTKSPPRKMLIKSMGQGSQPPPMIQGSDSRGQSPIISQLTPQNSSFSVGPPQSTQPNQNLPHPTPIRPAVTVGKPAPSDATLSNPDTTSLPVPHPKIVSSHRGPQQEIDWKEEEGGTDTSDGVDIQFDEGSLSSQPPAPRESMALATPQQAPRMRTDSSSSSSSSTSSLSIKRDADEVTALPQDWREEEDPVAARRSHQPKPVSASTVEEKKARHRSRRSSGSAVPATEARYNGKDRHRRKHRHHHHRSRSAEAPSHRSHHVSADNERGATHVAAAEENRRQSSPRQPTVQERHARDCVDDAERHYGATLAEAAFTPQALTSTSRNRIAEEFLSILCPQQYYGKVLKINRIRPFKANRASVTGLRSCNSIYVATKGTMPNPYFYPQLRLRGTDGEQPTGMADDEMVVGAVDTPILLYEAAPGNMLFAETELDARRLLESSPSANSCFMLSNSAILFKDPEHYVLPVASLNVRWVPYASPQSEPQCPVHKRELQLFDPYSKELVCALCASRNGIPMSNFVVIPDVLGNADSRQTIQEKVSAQLDEAQQSARRWVEQHQRVGELCESKKSAICNQFDLLIKALEAKRKEYTEACEAEFAYTQTDVAREILITDEKVQLLKAASDHLHTDPSRALFSMQIATIAEGLSAATELPSRFTRNSLQLPPMSTGLVPNLEAIMSQVLELSPSAAVGAGGGGSPSRPRGTTQLSSPYRHHRPVDDTVLVAGGGPRRRSGYTAPTRPYVSIQQPSSRSASANQQRRSASLHNGGAVAPAGYAFPSSPSATAALRDESSFTSNSLLTQKRSANGVGPPSLYATDAVSVPNSTGTSLFDFALQDLLGAFDASNVKKRSPRYIQWAIRVEDPGDWVGLGVGVGNTIDAWEQGNTNDLSHLWIVPASMTGNVLYLRVTVQASSGHAKLTVHDVRGKQIDAGEVPQWNAARPSYPQATFGGRVGTVRMIEMPHAVR